MRYPNLRCGWIYSLFIIPDKCNLLNTIVSIAEFSIQIVQPKRTIGIDICYLDRNPKNNNQNNEISHGKYVVTKRTRSVQIKCRVSIDDGDDDNDKFNGNSTILNRTPCSHYLVASNVAVYTFASGMKYHNIFFNTRV